MNLEAIQEHSKFVRSLARRLVLDENNVDDITQKAFLTLLKKPPKGDSFPYGWLKTVVQNLDRMEKRSSIRRRKREEEVARSFAVRSTDEISERQALCQTVVDAVLELKEPYLTIIIMRFYDDQPPRRIAKSLDVPVTTVKSWLRRGLDQLRRALDDKFEGSRKSWVMALAPVGGLALTTSAAGATLSKAASSSLLSGKSVAVAGTLLVAAFLAFQSFLLDSRPDGLKGAGPGGDGTSGMAAASVSIAGADGSGSSLDNSPDERKDGDREPIPHGETRIPIKATDLVSGESVRSYGISVGVGESLHDNFQEPFLRKRVRSEDGTVSFFLERGRPGRYLITISSQRHIPQRLLYHFTDDVEPTVLEFRLDPGYSREGLVVDIAGRPIAGALIAVKGRTNLHRAESDLPGGGIWSRSDEKGRFIIQGLLSDNATIVAVHPLFAEGSVMTTADLSSVEIVLKPGFCVFGTALDDQGLPAAGISIKQNGAGIPLARIVKTDREGRFRLPPAPPHSEFFVTAVSEEDATAGRFTKERKKSPFSMGTGKSTSAPRRSMSPGRAPCSKGRAGHFPMPGSLPRPSRMEEPTSPQRATRKADSSSGSSFGGRNTGLPCSPLRRDSRPGSDRSSFLKADLSSSTGTSTNRPAASAERLSMIRRANPFPPASSWPIP